MSKGSQTPLQVLQEVFGHSAFRGDQEEVIDRALRGLSSLLLMPTGGGKSLCFQIPAKILPGTTLVVSPLIALMRDQVDQARRKGLQAATINSSLRREERERTLEAFARGDYELLYVTPERFRSTEFREACRRVQVPLLAVDEAHCISEWGGDFRPDYSRITEFRRFLQNPPVLALTATATPENQQEILAQLAMDPATSAIFTQDLRRPNLALEVHSVYGLDEKVRFLIGLNHQIMGAKIVYCALISTLKKLSDELRRLSVSHVVYHGDLDARARHQSQSLFMNGQVDLILATPAFGLGINKADIRAVVHVEIPGRLEAYYQEVGRAGRDGGPSRGALLYDSDDVSIQMEFLKWAHPDPGFVRTVFRLIQSDSDRVRAEGLDYLRGQLNFYNRRDYRLETALNLLERWGSIEWNRESRGFDVVAREAPSGAWLTDEHTARRLASGQRALLKMVQYAEAQTSCRMEQILNYFDPERTGAVGCGLCDFCTSTRDDGDTI